MPRYVEQLNETSDPVTGDFLQIYDASAGSTDKDRKVNISRFAILANTQTFTAAQTFTGGVSSTQPATGTSAVTVTPLASMSAAPIAISNIDNSSSFGPFLSIGRNSNVSTPAAGFIRLVGRTGNSNDIWADSSASPGVLRIGNGTTTTTDLGGSIVGAQTSSLDQKEVIEELTDYDSALSVICATPLYRFRYKDNRFGNPEYLGIITDYSPIFGADPDEEHPNGRILNEVNAHGYAMAAIRALAAQVAALRAEVEALKNA